MFKQSRIIFVATLLLSLAGLGQAEDYAARFKQLQDQKAPSAQIDSLLDEWRANQPNDPGAWITSANYYFNQGVHPNISTKQPEGQDFVIAEEKTGKVAGSLSFKPDPALAKKAAGFLEEATKRFPNRLDIWCGLAYINQERGDFESEFATLKNMVAYARNHSSQLRWLENAKLSEPADRFIPEKLHSYAFYYHEKGTAEGSREFFKIASFAAEQFPNHPYVVNDVAAFYADSRDNKKAREWMERAHRIDPKDTLVLTNLARTCLKLGDTGAARKWYEEVLRIEPHGEYADEAKQALAKLKKK